MTQLAPPTDLRPDPDLLLGKLQEDARAAQRGSLRIYLGASAGVGKTFAMLGAAHRALAAGDDVTVGLSETHGRAETAALLVGLEQLPRKAVEHRGAILNELDLDAALIRKPAVLLVDELAHTNAPGSRHPKRWQDIEELLDAGIDVWTALNVQHLESLNGTVGAITGIRVQETVPDTVLDSADEVVLVDVTADELIARLAAGKVYLPPQADRAAQNFFRKGNLMALREIALRRTAEHVEGDVRGWRVEHSGQHIAAWNTSGAILVCIGPGAANEDASAESTAGQTVRTAARLAGQLNVRWHAVYVETARLARLPVAQRDRILAVLKLAEEMGATTAVLTGDDVAEVIAEQARELNCATLVIGRPHNASGWTRFCREPLARRIGARTPTLDIVESARGLNSRRLARALPLRGQDALVSEADDSAPGAQQALWMRHAIAAAVCIGVSVAAAPLSAVLDEANIVMLFLLAVVGVALRLGRGPAALAAVLCVASFDFFFVQPRFSLAVSDVQYVVTFAVMLGVGLLVGQMTAGLRFSARVAASRERRAQALFELTRDLSAALESKSVAALGEAAVRRTFGGEAVVLVTDANDRLAHPAPSPAGLDASVADWVLRNGASAGLATGTLPASPWHYVPLKAPMRLRGVLALRPDNPRWLLIPEHVRQLDTLARQVAIALERVHYVEVAQQTVVQMESERLRNALLAAISHDVRTPLTALVGLADSLGQASPPLALTEANTARIIAFQARELAAMVTNLLDMARLQSGSVQLRSDWQSVEEAVGSAIRAAQHALGATPVRTSIAVDLPLVEFDAALIERVLVNLLENAARHGAPPLEVSAHVTDQWLVISVRDHGPGLAPRWQGHEEELFEKFTRGDAESAVPGVGLGLAICKAVMDAHRGRIRARTHPAGGAEFTIELPRRDPPPEPLAEH